MKKDDVKEEFIRRYKYIYENSEYILLPYMHKETKEERQKKYAFHKKQGILDLFNSDFYIYLKTLPTKLLLDLESFLLSDIPLEESNLFVYLEENKNNPKYLKQVAEGLELLKEKNNYTNTEILHEKLGLSRLLSELRVFIMNQSGDLDNKKVKLDVLDEYIIINNYRNNENEGKNRLYSFIVLKEPKPNRDKKDIGLKSNIFLKAIFYRTDKEHIQFLSEEEKQQIYLTYNDELPWNLKINCSNENFEEDKLKRPENTTPCNKDFYINEKEMFKKDEIYYQRCKECGYIVNIPTDILTKGVSERIDQRMEENPNLYRINILKSELQGFENKPKVKLLKPNNK